MGIQVFPELLVVQIALHSRGEKMTIFAIVYRPIGQSGIECYHSQKLNVPLNTRSEVSESAEKALNHKQRFRIEVPEEMRALSVIRLIVTARSHPAEQSSGWTAL